MTILGTLNQLARKRQDLGVSLAEISRETKINRQYLEAIEEGQLEDVPGGIYLRSYVQQYEVAWIRTRPGSFRKHCAG